MKRGAARKPPEMRARILRAAAACIAEQSFHGMSMRDLAPAARTSLSNLYNYFPSKERILFALQREAFETLIASAEAALQGEEDPAARLYVLIAHHVRYFAENPDVMRVLVHEAASLPPAQRRTVRRLKDRYFRLGREIVAELMEKGCDRLEAGTGGPPDEAELDRMTYGVFGMVNWIHGWYRPVLHGTPQELARSIHRIALCGLVANCPFQALQAQADVHLDSLEVAALVRPAAEALL